MKEFVEYLKGRGIVCKRLSETSPKALGSRKKIRIFVGVDLDDYYCSFVILEKKSRVLRKEAKELMLLHEKLEKLQETKISKRYLLVRAPLCSHAKAMLEENGWTVWHESTP